MTSSYEWTVIRIQQGPNAMLALSPDGEKPDVSKPMAVLVDDQNGRTIAIRIIGGETFHQIPDFDSQDANIVGSFMEMVAAGLNLHQLPPGPESTAAAIQSVKNLVEEVWPNA